MNGSAKQPRSRIPALVREFLQRRGCNPFHFAAGAGVPYSVMYAILHDDAPVKSTTIEKIADAAGVPIYELLGAPVASAMNDDAALRLVCCGPTGCMNEPSGADCAANGIGARLAAAGFVRSKRKAKKRAADEAAA